MLACAALRPSCTARASHAARQVYIITPTTATFLRALASIVPAAPPPLINTALRACSAVCITALADLVQRGLSSSLLLLLLLLLLLAPLERW